MTFLNKDNIKTYLLMDIKCTKIYFYFTLKFKSVSLIGFSPVELRIPVDDSRGSSSLTMLLAQLAKNDDYCNEKKVWDSPTRINTGDNTYCAIDNGAVVPKLIEVECKEELLGYYEKHDFI